MVHVFAPHRLPKSGRLIIELGDAFVQGLCLQARRAARPQICSPAGLSRDVDCDYTSCIRGNVLPQRLGLASLLL